MNEEKVIPLRKWPKPSAGAPLPIIWADECRLIVNYLTANDKVAVVCFHSYCTFKFGEPNDEALNGHPLAEGLYNYSVHRVENSSWINQLEQQNSVHPLHNRNQYYLEGLQHYIFTFHDSTFEVVSKTTKFYGPPVFSVFKDSASATKYIQKKGWTHDISGETTNKPRFQFSAQFILLWVVPYVALAAVILAGPFGFGDTVEVTLDRRHIGLLLLTFVWWKVWSVVKRRREERQSAKGSSPQLGQERR